MTTRWEVESAVWHSELEPAARLLVLALARKADNDTAVVPPEHTPSLTTLQAMTGLSRATVAGWLNALEVAGWVKRTRPPKGSRTERTSYVLLVGSPAAQRQVRSGLTTEPVSPRDRPGLTTRPDLVSPRDPGSPPVRPAPLSTPTNTTLNTVTAPRERGTRIPDDFTATAEMIAWARENTPNVGAAETEAFIDYWRGVSGQRGVKRDWPATWRNWMRKEQRDHHARAGRPRAVTHRPYSNPADASAYHGDL